MFSLTTSPSAIVCDCCPLSRLTSFSSLIYILPVVLFSLLWNVSRYLSMIILEIFLFITETNSAIWIIQPITGAGHVQLCSKELIDNIYFSNWIQYCDKHNQVPRARHVLLCQKLHHTQQHCWGTILTSNMAIIYIFVFADTWTKLFILESKKWFLENSFTHESF